MLEARGRFSTDLDFTGIGEHDHEEIILEMMQTFDQPFHGIQVLHSRRKLLRNAGRAVLEVSTLPIPTPGTRAA